VVGARRTEQGTNRIFRVPAKWFVRRLAATSLTLTSPTSTPYARIPSRRDAPCTNSRPGLVRDDADNVVLSNGYQVTYTPIDYSPCRRQNSTGGATPSATSCRSRACRCRTIR
jgi:pectin methylesterase-like acyl-CoA thioesterase